MSFKENLRTKIRINQLAECVLNSLGPPDSGKKLDKQAMRSLLELNAFSPLQERDLDLYVQESDAREKRIVVLGNELAFFHASVADVAMRRSPTVKEMLSIRNAIKILNDKDIVISKGADTLRIIQKECLERLDLTFSEADLDEIVRDGVDAFQNTYADGVLEALSLFAELLEYQAPPKALPTRHYRLFGKPCRTRGNEPGLGPLVVYDRLHHRLKLIEKPVSFTKAKTLEQLEGVIEAEDAASQEGPDVFQALKARVMQSV